MAAVLAVVPGPVAEAIGSIRFAPAAHDAPGAPPVAGQNPKLADFLLADGAGPRTWRWPLAAGLDVTLELARPAPLVVGLADCLGQDANGPKIVAPPHKRASVTGSRIKRGRA